MRKQLIGCLALGITLAIAGCMGHKYARLDPDEVSVQAEPSEHFNLEQISVSEECDGTYVRGRVVRRFGNSGRPGQLEVKITQSSGVVLNAMLFSHTPGMASGLRRNTTVFAHRISDARLTNAIVRVRYIEPLAEIPN